MLSVSSCSTSLSTKSMYEKLVWKPAGTNCPCILSNILTIQLWKGLREQDIWPPKPLTIIFLVILFLLVYLSVCMCRYIFILIFLFIIPHLFLLYRGNHSLIALFTIQWALSHHWLHIAYHTSSLSQEYFVIGFSFLSDPVLSSVLSFTWCSTFSLSNLYWLVAFSESHTGKHLKVTVIWGPIINGKRL